MSIFQVSVIIPVYNAADFLERAVTSAINLQEVNEILLIEDGSKDNSLSICQKLAQQYPQIKLLSHENHQNKGAGASRNLGLKNAKCDYIAFLDADDYFLPNRFIETKKLFELNKKIDAVYEPVSCEFITDKARTKFQELKNLTKEETSSHLSYPINALEGKDFFESLIIGSNGYPCTDGITVEKKLIALTGPFNESLRLHQDSELWIRIAYYGNFSTPHSKVPVAVRSQHDNNRITSRDNTSLMAYNLALRDWGKSINLEPKLMSKIEWRLNYLRMNSNQSMPNIFKKIILKLIKAYISIKD